MSEKGGDMPKRFFINGTKSLYKRLQHLAIELEMGHEKLGAELLAEALARKEAEHAAKSDKGKRP